MGKAKKEKNICSGYNKPSVTGASGAVAFYVLRGKDKNSTSGYLTQHKITEYGQIISLRRFDYGHCGVYEGNDKFSDCRVENGGVTIHMRYMDDTTKPDYILKYNKK